MLFHCLLTGEFESACVIRAPRTHPSVLSHLQRIPALPEKLSGRLRAAGAGGEVHQPPRATPAFPSGHQSILRADKRLCLLPPLGSTPPFPPASTRGTMTETETGRRQRAPVMVGRWVGGARGVAFEEAVNTAGVRSSMETAFLSDRNTD